jgi:MFS family permease
MARRVLADVTPLRASPDFRRLWVGQLISFIGSQLTIVAVPFQVFLLTHHSSLQVGMVSLASLVPLIVGSLIGGAIADSTDRRRVMLAMQVLTAFTSAGLALNASRARPALWAIYVLTAIAAFLSGIDRPARSAAIPNLLPPEQLPSAYALWQTLLQVGAVAGPALAGVLIRFGLSTVYWIDVATFAAAFVAVFRMAPLHPVGGATKASFGSMVEGLRYLRGRQVLAGVFLVDLNAMIFGLPRAVFPALAKDVFHGTATTYGLMSAAPGAGALIGAVTTGWVGRVERQGRAVLIAVAIWGAAIAGFGATRILWLALLLLAIAGAADVVSAVFRNTILQSSIPDSLRGRLSAMQIAVVTGGPRLGDAEAGAVAAAAGATFSVVSGGLACAAIVGLLAWRLPTFRRYGGTAAAAGPPGPPHPPPAAVPEPPPVG